MDLKVIEGKIKGVYQEADTAISQISSVCLKGCSHCCHQSIPIVDVEGITIVNYIEAKLELTVREQIRNNIINWVTFFNSNTPSRVLNEKDVIEFEQVAAVKRIACPFLINNLCTIYEARPITCRTHIVASSPEECSQNPLRDPVNQAMQIKLSSIDKLSRIVQLPTAFRLLPFALLEDLDIKIETKRIMIRAYMPR